MLLALRARLSTILGDHQERQCASRSIEGSAVLETWTNPQFWFAFETATVRPEATLGLRS